MRRDEQGQLQLVEVITVAVILLTAIAISSVFRLPTSPATFQGAELERIGSDALRIMANTQPQQNADCNEPAPCPFDSELERMLSLAVGYVGPNDAGETPDRDALVDFLDQAMPDGVNWILYYSNGVTAKKVVPQGRNAPLLDVHVAHSFLAPNWEMFTDQLSDSVLVRTGEPTGFGVPDTIRDPLNRDQTEFGDALAGLFSGDVPDDAILGTHEICYGADCHYFTVTPSTIFGAGSQILPGDRDNSSNLKEFSGGDFFTVVKYQDADADGFTFTDALYFDVDDSGTVTAGDLRLSPIASCRGGATCHAGSFVRTGDSDETAAEALTDFVLLSDGVEIRGHDVDGSGSMSAGDRVYLAGTADGDVDADERRLSRVGVHAMGTSVVSGDSDEAAPVGLTFSGEKIWWDDADNDGALEPGEAVYLDLDGSGLGNGLEAGDYHLTTKGEATARYFYDVRLVVWFGV